MRKYIRHPADIPIEIQTQALDESSTENIVNISLGGLSIQCREPQDVGSLIKLAIKLVDPPFETVAQVVWCKAKNDGYELGVKLLDVDDAYRARMVEQICHIQHYKHEVATREG
ncbi:MAG: PilZ domain-containing protein, partial [Gammaproteobacteria bacterium]|nr:PilZ domain-containing protein [Gammaproteobacteria bacterium]